MVSQSLLFFDKNGSPINLEYDSVNDIWNGSINLPEVSIGLFENETIYLVERLKIDDEIVYGRPHYRYAAISHDPTTVIHVEMDPNGPAQIKLFDIDSPSSDNPIINFINSQSLIVDWIDDDVFDSSDNSLVTTFCSPNAAKIDVCFSSKDEDSYDGSLLIYDLDTNGVRHDIAKIIIHGETVGEDDRFNTMLSNFGEQLLETDEFIFRTSDIDEHLPDFKLLNKKRKELFIEYSNIVPYLSSYKGIINILKFFDYYDVKLKEYWLNPITGKYIHKDVKLIGDRSATYEAPSFPFRKTCLFGLYYDINEETGEYDENGLPVVKWSDNYSQDEILIKLFGLKNYIYRRNIGGVSKIIDIVGQAAYFSRIKLNVWKGDVRMTTINRSIVPSFVADHNEGYISDIRSLTNIYSCGISPDITMENGGSSFLWEFDSCWVSWFSDFGLASPDLQNDENEEVVIGYPVVLTNTTFDTKWSDCNTHWDEMLLSTCIISWVNVGSHDYYDAEWIVVYKPSVDIDHRSHYYIKRGDVVALKQHSLILPYDGKYDVTLKLYGYNGVVSKHTENGFINVQLKSANFVSFFKIFDNRLQWFNSCSLPWSKADNDWVHTVCDNADFPIGNDPITNRSLSTASYFSLEDDYDDISIGYRNIIWSDYNNWWVDFEFVTWNDLKTIYEKPSKFEITNFVPGGIIQINDDIVDIPPSLNTNDFISMTEILNASNDQFTFVARPFDVPTLIDCVSLQYGTNGMALIGNSCVDTSIIADLEYGSWSDLSAIWNEMPIVWSAATFIYESNGIDDPYSHSNIRYYDKNFTVPIMVPVGFTTDNCTMPGKFVSEWTIYNSEDGKIVVSVTNQRLLYRFTKHGLYDIKCTIYDTKGNHSTILKKSHINVLKPDEWKLINQY